MSDFVQMDVFFFISSVAVVLFILFITIIALYVIRIIKSISAIVTDIKDVTHQIGKEGKNIVEVLGSKVEEIVTGGGVLQKAVIAGLGTIIAKTFSKRGKIKKEAPKKK